MPYTFEQLSPRHQEEVTDIANDGQWEVISLLSNTLPGVRLKTQDRFKIADMISEWVMNVSVNGGYPCGYCGDTEHDEEQCPNHNTEVAE